MGLGKRKREASLFVHSMTLSWVAVLNF